MTRPIQPPMPDERLDRLVRQILAERADDVAASAVSADEMAERIATRLRPSPFRRGWVLLAAAMLAALVIGGTLIVGVVPRLPSIPIPPAPPASAAEAEATAEVSANGEDVRGWPDTNENPAGVYSWDGSTCSSAWCVIGFMHNGYGSGDVEIRIEAVPDEASTDDGGTPVTVAGHEGIYRRIGGQQEEWVVEIDGTTIAILLTAQPGTSQADLADAHAIIESMRSEPYDNRLGFRLVFTIPTDEWDSG